MQALRVLHVEDDFADAMLLQHALCDAGAYNFDLEVVRTLHDARLKLGRNDYDLIIADLRLPDSTDPNSTVSLLERSSAGAPILVLTGSAGVDAERIGPSVTVLDKNAFFHQRDDRKSRALLVRVREAAEGGGDGDDALML
jgi:CheY-like chemotaxis protein